jgi:hypothetical protein
MTALPCRARGEVEDLPVGAHEGIGDDREAAQVEEAQRRAEIGGHRQARGEQKTPVGREA